MIHSMTAFARGEIQDDWGSLTCEIRSINHRYLDISFYLSDVLRVLEMPLRDIIRQLLKRGKIDCSIRYQAKNNTHQPLFTINTELVQALCQASQHIAGLLPNANHPNTTEILRFPGVLEAKEINIEELQSHVFQLLTNTVKDLLSAREREGKELKQFFFQRLDALHKELLTIQARLPHVIVEQQERLKKRFNDAKLELDPNRLEQEMLIFMQKTDVAEEIDRVKTHMLEMKRILNDSGAVGRRLDFLLQELNREANTLGSKSADSILLHAAVEMKVLIEQIREQVQNIE